jgi:hypothetical protein
VSEQQAEQTSAESGSGDAGPAVSPLSQTQSQPVAAAPDLVPGQDADAGADAPKVEAAPAAEAPRVEAAKVEGKPEAPRFPGKLMIVSAPEWDGDAAGPQADSEPARDMFGKRRLSAMAAMVALAVLAGALGGALATAGFLHFDVAGSDSRALEASVARIDADILALKADVEHTSKLGVAQFNKTSDRLDKVEKAQAEPAAKLAKLSEAIDRLRATPQALPVPVATAPVASKEVTGSIAPAAGAPAKVEVGRLPTVEGWVLRDVANGGALIEGRQGMFEVYAGDPVPGLGRVDAIRRQDGRWVVVTSKGLIVARRRGVASPRREPAGQPCRTMAGLLFGSLA